jgi:hypothetical protein
VADAASTSTLVLVALSGGTGAFLGVVVNQVVQLRRDKKQYEREDQTEERERRDALAEARLQRQGDCYVEALTAVSRLARGVRYARAILSDWRELAEHLDDLRAEEVDPAIARPVYFFVHQCTVAASEVINQYELTMAAVFSAYPVASHAVRAWGDHLAESEVTWRGEMNPSAPSVLAPQLEADSDQVVAYLRELLPAVPELPPFISKTEDQLAGLAEACERLEAQMRRELRLE